MVAFFQFHLPQGSPEVVAGNLLHIVELQELVPTVAVHVNQDVAVLIRGKHLVSKQARAMWGRQGFQVQGKMASNALEL